MHSIRGQAGEWEHRGLCGGTSEVLTRTGKQTVVPVVQRPGGRRGGPCLAIECPQP